jgi:tetratricopeptide (TPR) repeat protein
MEFVFESLLGERKKGPQKTGLLPLFGVLFIPVLLGACDPQSLKEANRLYAESKYEEAANRYKETLVRNPDSETVHYSLGAALYKKSDYIAAIDHFTKALPTKNPKLEAKASYNIGNCKYRLGEEIEKRSASKAVEIYREALDYYSRAMDLEGTDEDMAYNYRFVENRLRKLVEQLKESASESATSPSSAKSEAGLPSPAESKENGSDETGDPSGEISKEKAEALLRGYKLEEESMIQAADRKKKAFDREVEMDW